MDLEKHKEKLRELLKGMVADVKTDPDWKPAEKLTGLIMEKEDDDG